jgi:hypothetical protein
LLIIQWSRAQEIRLENLDSRPGILPFKPFKIQYIYLKDIEEQITQLQSQLDDFKTKLENYTYILYKLQVEHLHNKLKTVANQLSTLEPIRMKRGLIGGLGSIIKSITGNLDYTDAKLYNDALETLRNDQSKLVSEINEHISLNKDWMSKLLN